MCVRAETVSDYILNREKKVFHHFSDIFQMKDSHFSLSNCSNLVYK